MVSTSVPLGVPAAWLLPPPVVEIWALPAPGVVGQWISLLAVWEGYRLRPGGPGGPGGPAGYPRAGTRRFQTKPNQTKDEIYILF